MMTKAAFFMQEHLRRNFAYITDVQYPNAFFCRGRLPFPQGLNALGILFHGKTPADAYAHPYFVEKQSDPSQPSPQLHITEELQGIIKVQRGLRYMKDDSCKLDDTMSFVTDYDHPIRGRLLFVQTSREQEAARAEEERLRDQQNRKLRPDGGHAARGGGKAGGGGPTITFSSSLAGDAAPATTASPRGEGDEVTAEERESLRARRIASRSFVSSFMYSGGGGGGPSPGRMGSGGGGEAFSSGRPGVGAGATGLSTPPAPNAPTLFPSAGESLRDCRSNHGFFHAVMNQRKDARAVSSPVPPPQVHLHDEDADELNLFAERVGGYTVLYNPIETNDRTFSDLMAKLNEEEKVVKVIVVPTRHAWRQVQVWADAFPDASIVSSGPIPLLAEDGSLTSTDAIAVAREKREAAGHGVDKADARPAGHGDAGTDAPTLSAAADAAMGHGMQDFGGGVTGMSFPEVDLEAEAAAARDVVDRRAQKQQQQQAKRAAEVAAREAAALSPANSSPSSPQANANPSSRIAAMLEERARLRRKEEEDENPHRRPSRSTDGGAADAGDRPEDPVDLLWSQHARAVTSSAGFAGNSGAGLVDSRLGGLRIADAHRVRDLSREGLPDFIQLTPSILLFHVKGDAITDEYVMYDYASKTLYCTDLFHGQYADLDPLNSWMCRVWFKFMKQGNHKRIDVVPRYKWRQVCGQGTLGDLQRFVDWLTSSFDIANIVQSHGSPPFTEDAANALRLQWDLGPLPPRRPQADGSPRRALAVGSEK